MTCSLQTHSICRATLADSNKRLGKLEQMLAFEKRKNSALRAEHTASQIAGYREQVLGSGYTKQEAEFIKDKLELLGMQIVLVQGSGYKIIKLVPED